MTVDMRELPAIVRQAAVDLAGAPALDILRWADEHLRLGLVRRLVDGRRRAPPPRLAGSCPAST